MIKKSLFSILLLISTYGIMHSALTEIVLLANNNDHNVGRSSNGFGRKATPEWRNAERMSATMATLAALIKKHNPHIIHLQEGRDLINKFGEKEDSITPLMKFLQDQGYVPRTAKYCPDKNAFSYITALKPDFTFKSSKILYVTKTPDVPTDHTNHTANLADIKAHNYGEEYERGIYITEFTDTDNNTYYSCNVHKGLGLEHRKQASHLINRWASEVKAHNPEARIIIQGDFNAFPDWGGEEQLDILKKGNVVTSASDELKIYDTKQVIKSSFFAYPHDFGANEKRLKDEIAKLNEMSNAECRKKTKELFDKECQALGGHLDHVFYSGFESAETCLDPYPLFEPFTEEYTEKTVKKYILDHFNENEPYAPNNGPAFSSDHQPIIAKFKIKE